MGLFEFPSGIVHAPEVPSPTWKCPRCGSVVPGSGDDGLCPICLLESGSEDPLENTDPALSESVYGGSGRLREPPSQLRYFGDYQILGELARGGMGVVYLARQTSLDRLVAVKLLLFGEFSGRAAVERFRTEAAAAARLQHPGIVAIHEIGEHEGQQYYSMEYVPGENLARRVIRQPPSPREAAARILEIVDAVHFAHTQGILHRDLKPANVLVTPDGRARVTDFGLAKRLDRQSELTGTGEVLGSPSFMAPEQVAGDSERIGVPTDVYGLGAILYYTLTGRAPLQASTVAATLDLVLREDPVSPRVLNPSVPRDLETICLRCLAKVPEQRYSDAAALGADLRRFLADEPIQARPAGVVERTWRWMRRRPSQAGLLAAAVFLVLTLAVGGFFYGRQREQARAREVILRADSDRQRYAMSINLAERARSEGDFTQADKLLQAVVPRPGDEDLRGWEWYHLRHELRGREERVLWSGTNEVLGLAASPRGDRVAVVFANELRLLAVANGESLAQWTLPDAGDGSRTILFTPDGTGVVAGALLGAVLCQPGQPGRTLLTEAANVLAFSADGSQLAFSSVDWSRSMDAPVPAGILEVESGRVIDRTATNGGPALAWIEPEGGRAGGFQMLGSRGVLSRWERGRVPEVQWGRLHFTDYAVFSPDQRQVVVDDVRGFYDWLTLTNGVRTLERPGPRLRLPWSVTRPVLAFRSDGKRVAAKNGADRRIAVCDGETGEVIHRYPGHRGELTGLVFLGDTATLVSASRDGTVRLWDTGKAPGNLRITNDLANFFIPGPQFSRDCRKVALAGRYLGSNDTFTVVALPEMRAETIIGGIPIAFTHEDSAIVVWKDTGELSLYKDASLRDFVLKNRQPSYDWDCVTADGRYLITRQAGNVRVAIDLSKEADALPVVTNAFSLVSAPTRALIAMVTPSGICLWNPQKIGLDCLIVRDSRALSFSPDSRYLAIGDIAGSVTVVELESRRIVIELAGHGGEINTIGFSPDGRTLVTGAEDRMIRFWNFETGAQLIARALPENIHWISFSHNGRWLIVGWDGAYEIIEVPDGPSGVVPAEKKFLRR